MKKSNGANEACLLKVEDLAVGVGTVLLQDINLELRAGETVALTGPSGCGKTTLLRSISGLLDPFQGRVLYKGRTPEQLGWPFFRRKVVLVTERPVLFDHTVRYNFEKAFEYRSSDGASFPRLVADELLEKFGLGKERINQPARTLSLGQQQRVSLIRALLVSPDVLLLDEPTNALDHETVSSVEKTIVEEAEKRGLATIIVTHDRTQAERLCDRIVDLSAHVAGSGLMNTASFGELGTRKHDHPSDETGTSRD